MEENLYDELESAVQQKPEYHTWGEVTGLELYRAVWESGAHVRFDENIHDPAKRYLRLEIVITPLDEMNAKYGTEWKGNITGGTKWTEEWFSAVKPSLDKLGIQARDLLGKMVHTVRKSNGKTYVKKTTNEVKELQDFLFVNVFQSREECLADYLEYKAGTPVSGLSDADFPAMPAAEPAKVVTPATPNNDILLKFAKALVVAAAKDTKDLTAVTEKVRTQLDANPMMKGKITIDTPAVLDMILEACGGDSALPF